MIRRILPIAVLSTALTVILAACMGCGGDDPVEPEPPPRITDFSAQPIDIMPGDSSLLAYSINDADSSKIFPDGSRLSPTSSGDKWVKPSVPTTYWLVAYNSEGRDSATLRVTMNGAIAEINHLGLTPLLFLTGDSTHLTWKTSRADSIVVDNGVGKLTPVDTGGLWLKPAVSTTYRAIAYNNIGRDTVIVAASVEVPVRVVAGNGAYYKGIMGSDSLEPTLGFHVEDAQGIPVTLPWIYLSLIEGDGDLTPDSLKGFEVANYDFSGSMTHAVVEAMVRDVDTTEVNIRTNAIVPGAGGQGQYVLFGDPYSAVLSLNGNPSSVDEDPNVWLNYAVYETTLGVVFLILDDNQSTTAEETEPVIGVIFTSNFTGAKTADSIGIGSTIDEVRAVYGIADTTYYDDQEPVAQAFIYRDEGLTFYTTVTGDSTVFELHVVEPDGGSRAPATTAGLKVPTKSAARLPVLRRFSR